MAFCIIFNKNLSIFYCNRRLPGKLGKMAPNQGINRGFLSIWWLVRWKKMAWLWCRNKVYNQQFLIQSLFQILAKHIMHFQQATSRNYLFFYKSKRRAIKTLALLRVQFWLTLKRRGSLKGTSTQSWYLLSKK